MSEAEVTAEERMACMVVELMGASSRYLRSSSPPLSSSPSSVAGATALPG